MSRAGEDYITISFIIGPPHQILCGRTNQEERLSGRVARAGDGRGA